MQLIPSTRPGDWLKMTDIELVRRLNPLLGCPESDGRKTGRVLMQPIVGTDGTIFGACRYQSFKTPVFDR